MDDCHQDPVRWAQERLERHYRTIEEIGLTQSEIMLVELLEELEELKAQFLAGDTSEASFRMTFDEHLIADAWRRGMVPDDTDIGPRSPYLRKLEALRASASNDPVAASGLGFHAKAYLASGEAIPVVLRLYMADRVTSSDPLSKVLGRPQVTEVRDAALAEVLGSVASKFGISLYGSSSKAYEGSACWVVAEAQKRLGKAPNTAWSLVKIMQKERRAAKAGS